MMYPHKCVSENFYNFINLLTIPFEYGILDDLTIDNKYQVYAYQ